MANITKRSPAVYKSPIFQLILQPDEAADGEVPEVTEVIFFIHKALLAEVSPELYKHAYNNMREGNENSMTVKDVEAETLELFVKWVYEGDYRASDHKSDNDKMLVNVKLYTFGDRFNIPKLQELAKSYDSVTRPEAGLMEDFIDVLSYIYPHLPENDHLLEYLTKYAAWCLEALRNHARFKELCAHENLEFIMALLRHVRAAEVPPAKPNSNNKTPLDDDLELLDFPFIKQTRTKIIGTGRPLKRGRYAMLDYS